MDLADQIAAVPADGRLAVPIALGVGLLVTATIFVLLDRARRREGDSWRHAPLTLVIPILVGPALIAGAGAGVVTRAVDDHHDDRVAALVAEHVFDTYGLVATAPADVTSTGVIFQALDDAGHPHTVRVSWRNEPPVSLVPGVPAPEVTDPITVAIAPPVQTK